jgi:hypothetical protein
MTEDQFIQAAKDMTIYTLGAAMKKYGKGVLKQQAIVGKLADMAMLTFAMESAWLRAEKALARDGEESSRLKQSMARNFIHSNFGQLERLATEVLASLTEGCSLAHKLDQLKQLGRYIPCNTIALRQEIAAAVSAAGRYVV